MARIRRRTFLGTTAAGVLAASRPAHASAPAVQAASTPGPLVIASANGNFFRHGGPHTAVALAFEQLTRGTDVLEALVAGVNLVELDPADTSVGYGGLPNADGVVQLDSCCMHGPTRRAGGVAALEGVRTPSRVAYAVMQHTDHHLLVGPGAQTFARQMGFTIEDDLTTEQSRRAWLEWKRRTDPQRYLDPDKRAAERRRVVRELVRDGVLGSGHVHGTIHASGISPRGEIAGVTTTSGLAWKIPGRVGDSPILGAGLYVDGAVGAAGSTGRGEANLFNLSSFLIVENLRRGMHPKDAGLDALRRVRANTVERRLRRPDGEPNFNLQFYVLDARGRHAGVALYGRAADEVGWAGQTDDRCRYAVCDANGPRTIPCEPLLEGLLEG